MDSYKMSCKKLNRHVLIAAVKSRPALWRINDKHFKKTELTSRLWKEVGGICKIEALEAKTKWKSLKDLFRREAQKAKSKWQYYQPMQFIRQYMLIGAGEEHLQNELDNDHNTITGDEGNDKNKGDQENSEAAEENVIFYPPLAFVDASRDPESASATKKRKMDDVYDNFIQIEQKRIKLLEKSILQSENSDLQFFKSLIPYMEGFSPVNKLKVRIKIQDFILQQYQQTQATLGVEELILKEESFQ